MLDSMQEFVVGHSALIFLIGLASFFGAVFALPYVVAHIPMDYFQCQRRRPRLDGSGYFLARCVKNLIGAVLLVVGFMMLFLPGQGLLTIFFGLLLINYPGKYRFERWLVGMPAVLRTINFLRAKHGHPPLLPPVRGHSPGVNGGS